VGQPILAAAAFQAALLAATPLFAQPTADWIRSPEPLKQAWGAHIIAEQKLTALIPDLLRVVESPDSSADADPARFAALDTLIQLNADVPLSDLEPLVDRFPTDVLILAARSHEDSTDLLLKLLDRQHNREAFVAVGDLLTPKRNVGFAKAAMKEFCESATVWVYNPDQTEEAIGQAIPSPRPIRRRTNWPETGSYRIYPGTGNSRQGWTLLADGQHPVSFGRTPNKGYTDHGFDVSAQGASGAVWAVTNKGYTDHGFDVSGKESGQQFMHPRQGIPGAIRGDFNIAIARPRQRHARSRLDQSRILRSRRPHFHHRAARTLRLSSRTTRHPRIPNRCRSQQG
jgi:hypothetical protein